ncbi:MAG: response regulator transcription factor [Actinomycetota bacterium]|nr:response regulator transcription factor [Actinomycetota bacterium]
MTAEPTRVVVVDDQELFRRGLTMLIGTLDGIDLVGEAGDGDGAVEVVLRTDPDVVLLDVRMPGRSGIDTCAELKALMPSVQIVMLTASDEESDLYGSIKSGASGYLLKSSSVDEVADAVRLVSDGQSLITPSMAVKLLDEFKQLSSVDAGTSTSPRLTERELDVLRQMARGRSNREIARVLFIAENTVKNHVRNILHKFQMHSRVEAVMYAMRAKLLDAP